MNKALILNGREVSARNIIELKAALRKDQDVQRLNERSRNLFFNMLPSLFEISEAPSIDIHPTRGNIDLMVVEDKALSIIHRKHTTIETSKRVPTTDLFSYALSVVKGCPGARLFSLEGTRKI